MFNFNYDLFYKDLSKVDLKKDSILLQNSNIDFLLIDKQIANFMRLPYTSGINIDFDLQSHCYYLWQYYFVNFPYELKLARKFNNNLYHRTTRLKKRIAFMLENFDCLFLTFTFNDKTLSNTNSVTRRRYVTRALRSLNCFAIANIDFGNTDDYIDNKGNSRVGTGREHYHSLVTADFVDNYDRKFFPYGSVNFERCYKYEYSEKKVAKYIIKFTNHCIKTSTDILNTSLIYIKPKKYKSVDLYSAEKK